MRRSLALAFFLCFAAIAGFAQSRLNGKWATDRPADPQTTTDARRKQSVQLEVSIEDAQASGALNIGGLGGTFYTFKDGKVAGNKIQFRTDPRTETTWTIEMVDDNTVMLYHGPIEVVVLGGPRQPASPLQVAAVIGPLVTSCATWAERGTNASICGIAQDQTKARIPGVTVTATNDDTGAKSTTITNGSGLYGFPGVIPGKYTLTASLQGFNTTTVSNLSIGDTQFLQDLTLEFPVRAPANPSAASCGRNDIVWCTLLHRAK